METKTQLLDQILTLNDTGLQTVAAESLLQHCQQAREVSDHLLGLHHSKLQSLSSVIRNLTLQSNELSDKLKKSDTQLQLQRADNARLLKEHQKAISGDEKNVLLFEAKEAKYKKDAEIYKAELKNTKSSLKTAHIKIDQYLIDIEA